VAAIAAIGAAKTHDVDAQRTPVSTTDLRGAIGRAYTRVTGQAPSATLLDTLTAQAALETGRGGKMYNYNFGGIKGAGPNGETAHYMTREVIGGKDVHLSQGFRAYDSLDAGADDYVRFLTKRYSGAVDQAQAGNVDGFAHALKQAGYYTAPESEYASALRGIGGMSSSSSASTSSTTNVHSNLDVNGLALLSSGGANQPPTAMELERVMDALSSSALRIAGPSDET
jgi:hypothetical protein